LLVKPPEMMLATRREIIKGTVRIPDCTALTPWIARNHVGRKYATTVIALLTQNVKKGAAVILRYRGIRGGSVAFSCFLTWTPPKPLIRRANNTNNKMMRALFHEYFDPPYSKAIRRQTMQ
jgi:hypothetical protein